MKKFFSLFISFLFVPIFALKIVPSSSGQWYPTDPAALNQVLDFHDTHAADQYGASVAPATIRAIIAPHAAIQYSGSVAAGVYRLINPKIKRIILLAPDHSGQHPGVSVSSHVQFSMPNGKVAVDTKTGQQLIKQPLFALNNEVFGQEHSLEVQLPFIARYVPKAKIVPLIVGPINCQEALEVAGTLKKYISKNTLVLVSSDFVHYGPRYNFTPFDDHQQLRVRHFNSRAINIIEHGTCQDWHIFMNKSDATICGSNPIKLFLALMQENAFGKVEPRLIAYDSSSKSDQDDFVTYVGMLFTTEQIAHKPIADQLTQQEQQGLLDQAHDVLNNMYDEGYDSALYNPITSFGVRRPLGAFTTLRTPNGDLRGCIGHITSNQPLYKTIAQVTQDAALHDSRFTPVTKKEVPSLDLKLSVLSSPETIAHYRDIILGTHGIILSRNGKSAVYLPSVAPDQGWNLEQTLSQLSQKAGLHRDSWRQKGTQFKVFSSLDFP